jgi:hypothetical protein
MIISFLSSEPSFEPTSSQFLAEEGGLRPDWRNSWPGRTQDVIASFDHDPDRCRHAGLEQKIRIGRLSASEPMPLVMVITILRSLRAM